MQKLSINSIYPFPINEGLTASFLSNNANLLQLGLYNISQDELLAFKKHPIKCGIYIDLPVILWLFDFGIGGQYDAPLDSRLYPRDQLTLFDIDNNAQGLAIEMHVVELKDKITKILRVFTLPHELTISFLSASQDQLSLPLNSNIFNQKLNEIYQQPIEKLLSSTKLYHIGI